MSVVYHYLVKGIALSLDNGTTALTLLLYPVGFNNPYTPTNSPPDRNHKNRGCSLHLSGQYVIYSFFYNTLKQKQYAKMD